MSCPGAGHSSSRPESGVHAARRRPSGFRRGPRLCTEHAQGDRARVGGAVGRVRLRESIPGAVSEGAGGFPLRLHHQPSRSRGGRGHARGPLPSSDAGAHVDASEFRGLQRPGRLQPLAPLSARWALSSTWMEAAHFESLSETLRPCEAAASPSRGAPRAGYR